MLPRCLQKTWEPRCTWMSIFLVINVSTWGSPEVDVSIVCPPRPPKVTKPRIVSTKTGCFKVSLQESIFRQNGRLSPKACHTYLESYGTQLSIGLSGNHRGVRVLIIHCNRIEHNIWHLDYYWQIAKLELWLWGLVIDNQRMTWTTFAILAMFMSSGALLGHNIWPNKK